MEPSDLPEKAKKALRMQTLLGWAAFPIVGPGAVLYARVLRCNRVEGMGEARRVYREALSRGRPTIVCANHLTMIDSIFLHHALASLADYLRDFRRFSWNVPAVENFTRHQLLRLFVYLGKTIPIDRAGDPAHHKDVLDKLKYVVAHGDVCTLFPEGGRSRSGRVEPAKVTYGVGQVLRELERPLVVCAYLRGDRQETWGEFPERGDTLRISVELLEPTTSMTGMRATRDLSRQVIEKLKSMEDAHFARRAERRS